MSVEWNKFFSISSAHLAHCYTLKLTKNQKGHKMPSLPEEVCQAWNDRSGPVVLTTVDKSGVPNAIYVTCLSRFSDDIIVVADNFFHKTRDNILAGSKASLLFITKSKKSYQVKGSIAYHDSGPVFDDMKKWNPPKHPGHAAAAIEVKEVYSGAEKIV